MKFTARELRILRQSLDVPQKQIARKLNISPQRYSVLENNDCRPTNRTLEILQALSLTERTARDFLDLIPK